MPEKFFPVGNIVNNKNRLSVKIFQFGKVVSIRNQVSEKIL